MFKSIASRRLTDVLKWPSAALLVGAIVTCWWASTRQGGDFIYPYMLSHSLLFGEPIYDRDWQLENLPAITGQERPGEGFFYPAGTGIATLPLAALSYRNAQLTWLAGLIAAVVLGTASLMRCWGETDKNASWMAVAGLVLLSAAIRWGMTPLQGAPLVMGLLCLFMVSIRTHNYPAAFAITTFVLVLKFTVALPFLTLMLLLGKWRETCGAVAIAGLAHMLSFARVGGLAAFSAYTQGVSGLEALGSINTPDPWDAMSSPRTDWTYLFTGIIGDPQLSRSLSLLASSLAFVWLLWLGLRLRRRLNDQVIVYFLLAATCFGLLCVYHHHYDLSAALVPFLLLGILHLKGNKLPTDFLLLTAPLVVFMAVLPVAMTQRILISVGGASAAGYMNISFPASATLALLASCIQLTRLQLRKTDLGDPATR